MNAGTLIAINTIASIITMYIALLKNRSLIYLLLSFESREEKCEKKCDILFFGLIFCSGKSHSPLKLYAYFAASAIICSWVASFARTSPDSLPPDITRILSQTPKSSGISDDTIITVFPSWARFSIS